VHLDDEQLEALRVKNDGKIGVVDFSGHQIVFRRPTRDAARDWRRKQGSVSEKPDANDQLAQAMIIAFDGDTDANSARTKFTSTFLVEYPMAVENSKFQVCLGLLSGMTEKEDDEDLGKGVSIKRAPPKLSPTA
jgi:hypothetical protein